MSTVAACITDGHTCMMQPWQCSTVAVTLVEMSAVLCNITLCVCRMPCAVHPMYRLANHFSADCN